MNLDHTESVESPNPHKDKLLRVPNLGNLGYKNLF